MYVEGKVQENIEKGELRYFHPIAHNLPILTAYTVAIVIEITILTYVYLVQQMQTF